MHEHQHNLRISAARAFMESLDQLHNILTQERRTDEGESQGLEENASEPSTDFKLLEEVAADLDEFFGEREQTEEEVLDDES